ncbi:hypothetical protein V8F33_012094 [Rhypophila sp. PSN 637]
MCLSFILRLTDNIHTCLDTLMVSVPSEYSGRHTVCRLSVGSERASDRVRPRGEVVPARKAGYFISARNISRVALTQMCPQGVHPYNGLYFEAVRKKNKLEACQPTACSYQWSWHDQVAKLSRQSKTTDSSNKAIGPRLLTACHDISNTSIFMFLPCWALVDAFQTLANNEAQLASQVVDPMGEDRWPGLMRPAHQPARPGPIKDVRIWTDNMSSVNNNDNNTCYCLGILDSVLRSRLDCTCMSERPLFQRPEILSSNTR